VGEPWLDRGCGRHGSSDLDRAGAANHVAPHRRGPATIGAHLRAIRNPHTPFFHQAWFPADDADGCPAAGTPHKCHQCCGPIRSAGFRRAATTPIGSACRSGIHHRVWAPAFCSRYDRSERRSIRTTRNHCATDRYAAGHPAHDAHQRWRFLNPPSPAGATSWQSRSPRMDATVSLLIHGWPGSAIDVTADLRDRDQSCAEKFPSGELINVLDWGRNAALT